MNRHQVVHTYFGRDILANAGVIVLGEYDYLGDAEDALPEFEKKAISPLSLYNIRTFIDGHWYLYIPSDRKAHAKT